MVAAMGPALVNRRVQIWWGGDVVPGQNYCLRSGSALDNMCDLVRPIDALDGWVHVHVD